MPGSATRVYVLKKKNYSVGNEKISTNFLDLNLFETFGSLVFFTQDSQWEHKKPSTTLITLNFPKRKE